MGARMMALAAAALAAVVVNFVGVVFFFRPIAEADPGGGWLPPPVLAFLVYVGLSVLVLDRGVQRFGEPLRVALLIAFAQVILIIDLVLRGDRGVATGVAGAVLVLVTWTAMGVVYGRAGGKRVPEARPRPSDG